jgi:hypothetical protein
VVWETTAGVQPRSLPGKVCVPELKVPTWPETVQPGTVFRVVVTCAPGSVPWLDSVAPLTFGRVKWTVALVTVSLNVPVFGICWTIVSVPFVVGVVVVVGFVLNVVVPGAVAVVILYGSVPDEPLKAVEWVGVNAAVTVYVPTGSVVSVTKVVPVAVVTGTVPSVVAPAVNFTVPAAFGETVAVNFTEVPCFCGLVGVALTVVVVLVGTLATPVGPPVSS